MKIFLSHSSRQKPLVREVRGYFPAHIATWLDEEQLLIGDQLETSLQSAIKSDIDYVILFLDDSAAKSAWVKKEVLWALETERMLDRNFLLPVIIDDSIDSTSELFFAEKKYLSLKGFTGADLREFSNLLSSEIFALVCRDLHKFHNPGPQSQSQIILDAEAVLASTASLIQKAVFPHRKSNPISTDMLRNVINSETRNPVIESEFESILSAVVQRNLVPGLAYDGYELYVVEEHSRWKSELNRENKIKVGRKAASYINNGDKIFLDAGSTTEAIVQILCKRIETRTLTKITVATTSINHANMISQCCVNMGFDDEFSAIRLFIPGGQVRPGTQAVIPFDGIGLDIDRIAEFMEGFDLCFVGVNGVHIDHGFTTHENSEAINKAKILKNSKKKFILCDSSKVGIVLERKFVDFGDGVVLIVNSDSSNPDLKSLCSKTQNIVDVV
jgi:DeoR/GlpR family transcriptional regulator of sugar metabolism